LSANRALSRGVGGQWRTSALSGKDDALDRKFRKTGTFSLRVIRECFARIARAAAPKQKRPKAGGQLSSAAVASAKVGSDCLFTDRRPPPLAGKGSPRMAPQLPHLEACFTDGQIELDNNHMTLVQAQANSTVATLLRRRSNAGYPDPLVL